MEPLKYLNMVFDSEIIIRFLLALLWGGLVGAEREYRGKAAGFRTTIMISFGACFFTLMSTAIGSPNNPDRIASNIVTGIGFLGAGVIFRGEDRVNGITTAATIWAVAAIGMGIGAGYYFAAGCASFLILFILAVLPFLQKRIDRANQSKTLLIVSSRGADAKTQCQVLMQQHGIRFRLVRQSRDAEQVSFTWHVQGPQSAMDTFLTEALEAPYILRMEC